MIPQKIQKDIAEYQKVESQLEYLIQQKLQLQGKLNEVEQALELLKEQPADTVLYKAVGSLLVKGVSKESIERELQDTKETTAMRLKSLEPQEQKLKEKFETLQQNINEAIKEINAAKNNSVIGQQPLDTDNEYQ